MLVRAATRIKSGRAASTLKICLKSKCCVSTASDFKPSKSTTHSIACLRSRSWNPGPPMSRDIGGPGFQDRLLRHAIECVVDFDGLKSLAVETQHLLFRQIFRVEAALPLFIRVAARTNIEVHMQTMLS